MGTFPDPAIITVIGSSFPMWAITIVLTNPGIGPPWVIMVWPVVGIPYRVIELPVRVVIHHAESNSWPHKVPVKRTVHINPVIDIYVTGVMAVISTAVIKYPKVTDPAYPTVPVTYIYITDLIYTTVGIIINGRVFYLDDCSVIVILYEGIVIISRVKSECSSTNPDPCTYSDLVFDIKIEFPIRINGEGNSIFDKNEGVARSIGVVVSFSSFRAFGSSILDASQEHGQD